MDLERNEIEVAGVRIPVLGPIQKIPVLPFASKITVGDYTRDSEIVASSWIQDDWRGGFGVWNGSYPKDQDRFYFSTLETRFYRSLALPPRPETILNQTVSGSAKDRFLASGADLFEYTGSSLNLLYTSFYQIIDLDWSYGLLAFARNDADLVFWDGSSFQVQDGVPAHRFVWVGGWGVAACRDGTVKIWDRQSWNDFGRLPVPLEEVVALFAYSPSPTGEEEVFLLAWDGVYHLNRSVGHWYRTHLSWGKTRYVGKPAIWRGEVFIPVRGMVVRWNGSTVSSTGPDRGEGLPASFPKQIYGLFASSTYLILALWEPTDLTELWEIFSSNPLEPIWCQAEGDNFIYLVSVGGNSWHYLGKGAAPIGVFEYDGEEWFLFVSAADGTTKGIRLGALFHNPYVLPTVPRVDSGSLVSPWFDASWLEIPKVGLEVHLSVPVLGPGDQVRVVLENEDGEVLLVGVVQEPGKWTFPVGDPDRPFLFRKVRYRLDLERGSDPSGPVVESVALSFLRRPRQRWAYNMTLDFSREWRGMTPTELSEFFQDLVMREAPFLLRLPGIGKEVLVVVSRLQWAETFDAHSFQGDFEFRGRASVSFLEVT